MSRTGIAHGRASTWRPSGGGRAGDGDLIGALHRLAPTQKRPAPARPRRLPLTLEGFFVVGVDVHKPSHTAALLDDRGGELGMLRFANRPDGWQTLLRWLGEHGARDVVVGVENAAGYGRAPGGGPGGPGG